MSDGINRADRSRLCSRAERCAALQPNGDFRAWDTCVLFNSRRAASLWPSAETPDSNDLPKVCMDCGIRDRNRIIHRHPPDLRVFLMTTNSPSEKRLEQLR